MSTKSQAEEFMQRATRALRPHVEAAFGPLPAFRLVSRRPDLQPGHPVRGRPVGGGFIVDYDIPTRGPGIYYDPDSLMKAIRKGYYFYLNMIAHELMHIYQLTAEIKLHGWTHELLVAKKSEPYNPTSNYWGEGAACVGELQVMIKLINSGAWKEIARATFGYTNEEEMVWGENGLEQRIFAKLASMIILASRKHGRKQYDLSLVPLPFALPRWLNRLHSLPPYRQAFPDSELPYFMGAYHCCRWLKQHNRSVSQLLRTPIPNRTLRTY